MISRLSKFSQETVKHSRSFWVAALGVAIVSLHCSGQTSLPAKDAAAENSPQAAELKFEMALFAGDKDAASGLAYFADDETKAKGQVLLGEAAARFKVAKAIALKYSEPTKQFDEAMIRSLKDMLARSTVEIQGKTATVDFQGKVISHLVQDQGIWKVDFGRLAHENGDSKEDVEAAATRLRVMETFLEDLKADKFPTAREARATYYRRLSDAAPATKPSPATTRSSRPN